MEMTGFVFVCIIFAILLGVAGYCCLKVCSSESPYKRNDEDNNDSHSLLSLSSRITLQNESPTEATDSPKTSAPAANGIATQPHSRKYDALPQQPPVSDLKVETDEETIVYPQDNVLYSLKLPPTEDQGGLDELKAETETNRSCCTNDASKIEETNIEVSELPETCEASVDMYTSAIDIFPEPILIINGSNSISGFIRKKTRHSSEPPLPPPPAYAEAMANRRSLIEPPLPREYLI